jgi:hypothetical protein
MVRVDMYGSARSGDHLHPENNYIQINGNQWTDELELSVPDFHGTAFPDSAHAEALPYRVLARSVTEGNGLYNAGPATAAHAYGARLRLDALNGISINAPDIPDGNVQFIGAYLPVRVEVAIVGYIGSGIFPHNSWGLGGSIELRSFTDISDNAPLGSQHSQSAMSAGYVRTNNDFTLSGALEGRTDFTLSGGAATIFVPLPLVALDGLYSLQDIAMYLDASAGTDSIQGIADGQIQLHVLVDDVFARYEVTPLTPAGDSSLSVLGAEQFRDVPFSALGVTVTRLPPVPEPTTLALLECGIVCLVGCAFRRAAKSRED